MYRRPAKNSIWKNKSEDIIQVVHVGKPGKTTKVYWKSPKISGETILVNGYSFNEFESYTWIDGPKWEIQIPSKGSAWISSKGSDFFVASASNDTWTWRCSEGLIRYPITGIQDYFFDTIMDLRPMPIDYSTCWNLDNVKDLCLHCINEKQKVC